MCCGVCRHQDVQILQKERLVVDVHCYIPAEMLWLRDQSYKSSVWRASKAKVMALASHAEHPCGQARM